MKLTAGEQDAIVIDAQGIDSRIMPAEVVHKSAFGALPLLDVVPARRAGREGEFGGMDGKRANGLFVVRQLGERFPCCEVP